MRDAGCSLLEGLPLLTQLKAFPASFTQRLLEA